MPDNFVMPVQNDSTSQTPEVPKGWLHRNWKWIVLVALAAIVLSRFTLHFGYVDEDKRETLELIGQFHQRMNAGLFDDIYNDADPAFKQALTREVFLKHMHDTGEKYGQFRAVRASKLNVVMGAPVQTRAACDSAFEKGDATELFSFAREGHRLRLLIYGIQPPTNNK